MCKYGLLGTIISDNKTQFASVMVIDFCKELKKRLDDAKVLWAELLPEILCLYHTTQYFTTNETPFYMVYEANFMLHVEIKKPSWRQSQFKEEANEIGLISALDLIDGVR